MINRSNRLQVSYKIGIFKNFASFAGKHLCWNLFLAKLQLQQRSFPVKLTNILKKPFFTELLRCLLLDKAKWVWKSSVKIWSRNKNLTKSLPTHHFINTPNYRSSRPEVPCKKRFSYKFCNTCARDSFSIRLWHRCFPVNFAKFLRTPLLTEHPRWLLL